MEKNHIDEGQRNKSYIRIIIGVSAFIALMLILRETRSAAVSEMDSWTPDIIEVGKIFLEGAFYAIIAIGSAICAYIATR